MTPESATSMSTTQMAAHTTSTSITMTSRTTSMTPWSVPSTSIMATDQANRISRSGPWAPSQASASFF